MSSDDPISGRAWKWWICALLFAATVLNYLDRQTMAVCAPLLTDEFELSDEQFGGLLSAFRWTYALAQIPAGLLADRLPVRSVYAWAVALWSLAGAAAALTRTPQALAWTRRALGLGESFNWPCALRVTADILPEQDRGLGNGIFVSGSAVGAITAPLIIGPIASAWGWRAAFATVGLMGGVWVAGWLLMTRGRAARLHASAGPQAADRPAVLAGLIRVLGDGRFWLLAMVSALVNPCWYFCAEWLPKYMHDQRGFGFLAAGMVTIPIFVGADLGNITGGAMVKYLASRSWSVRSARSLVVSLGSLLSLCAILPAYVDHPVAAVAALTTAAVGLQAFLVNYLACVQEVSFVQVGLVAGILGLIGNVVGATVNPWIGRYVDTYGNYHLILILVGILPLLSLGAILWFDWGGRRVGD